MLNYVTGFLFSEDLTHVVLLEKQSPPWQKGLFNGVGGKIEKDESSVQAMARECKEETNVFISKNNWTCFAHITKPNASEMDVYFAISDLAFTAKTMEMEQVHTFKISDIPKNIIPNLQWLIPMALDKKLSFKDPVTFIENE